MCSNKGPKVAMLTIILILGSFTVFITPKANAAATGEVTTLYFTDISSFDFDNLDDMGELTGLTRPMSQTPPTKKIDSEFPPTLFVKNESKILKDVNDEEWITWLYGWTLVLLDTYGYNLSDLLYLDELDELGDLFEGVDLEFYLDLLLQNPMLFVGSYKNDVNESIKIDENVKFNLYFDINPHLFQKYYDKVKIGLYSYNENSYFPLPKLIKNTTVQLNYKLLSDLKQINLDNISYVLKPGESLLFSIKIIPSEKPITSFIKKDGFFPKVRDWIQDFFINRIDIRANKTTFPKAQQLAILLQEFKLIVDEFNISKEDIGTIIDGFRASSFLYNSEKHPSSVSVPFTIPEGSENTKVFYLHSGNSMDLTQPGNSSGSEESLTKNSVKWTGETLGDRNKIIKEATASLYIKNLFLFNLIKKKSITLSLIDGETKIASKNLDFNFRTKNKGAVSINFEELNYEMFYDHQLDLEISLAANVLIKGLLRKTKLLYDSETYPSSLTVTFSETENIGLNVSYEPENAKILPNGEMTYTLEINSKYDDEINLNITEIKDGDWSYTINQDLPILINAGETEIITVDVKSENNKKDAYGNEIELTFIASGKTGIDQKIVTAEVSRDVIDYDLELYGQETSKNIKKGSSGTFYFVIENKNTGAIDDEDSYSISAESENGYEIKYTDSISSLEIGEKTDTKDVKVIVYVPKNTTLDSDVITVTVTSDTNPDTYKSLNVTVNVKEESVTENLYNIFEKIANSLGLDDVFGDNALYALAGIIFIIIAILFLIIIFIFRRKSVIIICTDRIKEIEPDEKAVFDITIKNPTRKIKTYDLHSNVNPLSTKWQISTDLDHITVAPNCSKQILLVANPTKSIEPNDWSEIKLLVNVSGKKKISDITAMVMVKDGKAVLQIKNVFNWPKEFKKGDRITTSFKLENKGNITAKNAKIILFINRKEKNKVEVSVPSGGYADIKIPWIAQKGKNELQLKIVE